MSAKPETLSFQQLLSLVTSDWKGATEIARRKTTTRKRAFQKGLWEEWAVGYRLAQVLESDSAKWVRFSTEPIWGNRNLNPSHKLRFALQYTEGHVSGPEAELSCTHANALAAAFHAKVPAAKIPNLIETAGGIGKLLKAHRVRKSEALAARQTVESPVGAGFEKAGGKRPRITMPALANGRRNTTVGAPGGKVSVPRLVMPQLALPAPSSVIGGDNRAADRSPQAMYPDGSLGMWKLDVFMAEKDFFRVMRLDVGGKLPLEIERVPNGASLRVRIHGTVNPTR